MRDFPEELRPIATSLSIESGEKQPRPLVLARLLESLEEWLSLHETEGFGPVKDRFCELSSTLGRRVRITSEGAPIEGDAAGLDDGGALLVRDASGALLRVVAGEVEHCRVL
jgi:BirA family biotin operon repressor/biotin-[acetyl-CoA-carboxylase] ligase